VLLLFTADWPAAAALLCCASCCCKQTGPTDAATCMRPLTSAMSPNSVTSFLSVGVIVTLTDSSGSTTSLYTTSTPDTVTSCQPKG
jgi:hypothetical protein